MIETFTPEQEALIPVYDMMGMIKWPEIQFFDSPYAAFRAIERKNPPQRVATRMAFRGGKRRTQTSANSRNWLRSHSPRISSR